MSKDNPEERFRLMAARGKPKLALAVLDRLDAANVTSRQKLPKGKRRFSKIKK